MFQQVSLRIANKMAKEMVIDAGKVRVYAFGLELLLSSAAGVLALVAASILGKKPLVWVTKYGIPYLNPVSATDWMYLGLKKDDASTSTAKLYVTGAYNP